MVVLVPIIELGLAAGLAAGALAVGLAALAPAAFGVGWLSVLFLPVIVFLSVGLVMAVAGWTPVAMTLVGALPLFGWAAWMLADGPFSGVAWAYGGAAVLVILTTPVAGWLLDRADISDEEFDGRDRQGPRTWTGSGDDGA